MAILAASELTYVEASATQQSEDWARSNERALHYYGGGTEVIIPDNLRSAVSRSDPYEPGINPQFDAFAQHYGVVKNLVGCVKGSFFKQRRFHDREDLEAQLRQWLKEVNNERLSRATGETPEQRRQQELSRLRPLRVTPERLGNRQ